MYFDEIITKNRCSDVCRRQIEITFKKKRKYSDLLFTTNCVGIKFVKSGLEMGLLGQTISLFSVFVEMKRLYAFLGC